MARVRDHAAEYAALKARAQAAGLSTRAYRRARAENPLRYGAPVTQKRIRQRLFKFEPIEIANTTKPNVRAALIRALAARGATGDLAALADNRIAHATPELLYNFTREFPQFIRVGDDDVYDRFWMDDEQYADYGPLLWYRD